MKFLIGTDPECFIINTKTGQYVSAEGIIPGTKEDPFKVDRGAVQVDGLAAEFNTDPTDNEDEFVKNINTVKSQLLEMVKSVDSDLDLVFTPYVEFEEEYFKRLPAKQKVLGCDPDFNLEGLPNPTPANADMPSRTASAHVHIGWTEGQNSDDPSHFFACLAVAKKAFEMSFHNLGITTQDQKNLSDLRRQYYGKPGAFRSKPYGVELRCPNNFWITSEDWMRQTFRLSNQVIKSFF